MTDEETRKGIKSTETSFAIVEHLKERGPSGVTELAEKIGHSKSSIHAHLYTLEQQGYILNSDGEYRLALEFLRLGGHLQTAGAYKRLYSVAKPEIDNLATQYDERVQLTVEEGGNGYFLYQAAGSRAVAAGTHVGSKVPLHATASGKVILAHYNDERTDEILGDTKLDTFNKNTITDPETLREDLDRIVERGFAYDKEEQIDGVHCIAAPIILDDDTVIGALSMSFPANRSASAADQAELESELQNVARVISLNTSYR